MTDRPVKNPNSAAESAGLLAYFQSQAVAMLAQYDNINQLLGPTNDWTHPGTLCEVLLRDFLRKYMLNGMSVDKGYFFGRIDRDGESVHCPEIDILIHDERRFRPLFRMGDFVIVQPEAVLAMIQVKRTLSKGPLDKGIAQVIGAKQHLLDVVLALKLDRTPKDPAWSDLPRVFTAVLAFEEKITDQEIIRESLLTQYRRNRKYAYVASECDTGVYVLPHLIGSIRGACYSTAGRRIDQKMYWNLRAADTSKTVALQVLLSGLMDMFWEESDYMPFGLPEFPLGPLFQVPRPNESLHPIFGYGSPPAPSEADESPAPGDSGETDEDKHDPAPPDEDRG